MTRGDVVVIATRGAYTGTPRPALVVQDDLFNEVHSSITVCLVTSALVDAPLFRVALPASTRTGLEQLSHVMIDKLVSVPRDAIGKTIGRCSEEEMETVEAALRRWLAL